MEKLRCSPGKKNLEEPLSVLIIRSLVIRNLLKVMLAGTGAKFSDDQSKAFSFEKGSVRVGSVTKMQEDDEYYMEFMRRKHENLMR